MSTPATARIRSSALVTAAIGALVIAAIVTATGFALTTRLTRPSYAWQSTDPPAAVTSDGGTTWSAGTSAYIDVPASLGPGPLAVAPVDGGPVITVELSDASRRDGGPPPAFIGLISRTHPDPLVVVTDTGSRLWITAGGNDLGSGAWKVTLTPVATQEITEPVMTGRGDALLRYAGPALAGTIEQTGSGLLGVDLITAAGEAQTFSSPGAGSIPLVWPQANYTVIRIRSNAETAEWTLRLDTTTGAPQR